jgi:hypothetical protein
VDQKHSYPPFRLLKEEALKIADNQHNFFADVSGVAGWAAAGIALFVLPLFLDSLLREMHTERHEQKWQELISIAVEKVLWHFWVQFVAISHTF